MEDSALRQAEADSERFEVHFYNKLLQCRAWTVVTNESSWFDLRGNNLQKIEKVIGPKMDREEKRKEDIPWRSKAEEYEIISNLTGFDNLRAMMEGESTMKRRKRRRRRRRKRKNNNDNNEVTGFHAQQLVPRKPRYFDLPIGSWGTCFSCGEDHPEDANCELRKPVKACFLCGSLQHVWKHCTQGQYCFVCRGTGHQANDCLGKQEEDNLIYMICLRCGDSGHDMFSCRNDYSPDDLKKTRCYICNDFGHLSCVKLPDRSLTEVSCYNCGEPGHLGSACSKSRKVVGV